MLYRLTDERRPKNRDEINVTMADGSRSLEARSRRAMELLDYIRSPKTEPPANVSLDFKQATELLEMFGGEPGEITLTTGDGHSGKGLYGYCTDQPQEGAIFLGVSDEEAMPETAPAAVVGPSEVHEAIRNVQAQYLALTKAAVNLVTAVDDRHDHHEAPLRYTIPYGAVTALREAITAAPQPAPAAQKGGA